MNCLALQGGGVLGYGQALILDALEQKSGASAASQFQFVAGTSVGAIIGAPVALGLSASVIKDFFTKHAPLIFQTNWLQEIESAAEPKYSAAPLEAALQTMLGFKTLADCKIRFIATAFDCTSGRPVYFKSYEKSSEDDNGIVIGNDSGVEMWQVCRASSAAQTYFPAYELGEMVLIDGGNAGDNAPDVLLAVEAEQFVARYQIQMLSLGTGVSKWTLDAKGMLNPSPLRAGLETIKILFAAGVSADMWKAKHMLGDQHFRLSPDLGDGIAIDDAVGALSKIPAAIDALLQNNEALFVKYNSK